MAQNVRRLLLVTGPSGAGRTTATNALEDLGYETIDNIPLSLVPNVIEQQLDKSLALVIDARNRDFSVAAFMALLGRLRQISLAWPEILYLDCRTDILLRRFSETRRRHPMSPEDHPSLGVGRETLLLAPIKAQADFIIDSSDLSPHDLKKDIAGWFATGEPVTLTLSLQSFSYKKGLPRDVDMVLDCRFLKNPHWEQELRPLSGLDAPVATYIQSDRRYGEFFQRSLELIQFLLPAYQDEGKSHLSVGLGCTGGRHRSVAVAASLGQALAQWGGAVSIRHREIEQNVGSVVDQTDWPAQ